jgi:hypothetical protein
LAGHLQDLRPEGQLSAFDDCAAATHCRQERIVASDGCAIVPTSKPQPDGTLVKALARAWRWQKLLDEGVYASVSEIGDAENISKS